SRMLWVGTQSGGVVLIDLDHETRPWRTFSDDTDPALPNNTVNQVQVDASGRVYLFTNKGVARLTPRATSDGGSSDFEVYTFTTDDGLPSNEFNAGAAFVDGLGRIWAGTVGGAAMLDPSVEIEDRTAKPLHLSRAAIAGKA